MTAYRIDVDCSWKLVKVGAHVLGVFNVVYCCDNNIKSGINVDCSRKLTGSGDCVRGVFMPFIVVIIM